MKRGENFPLADLQITIALPGNRGLDCSAVLLTDTGKVRDDSDLIFFNNPVAPGVVLRGTTEIAITVAELPPTVTSVQIIASLDGSGLKDFGAVGPAIIRLGADIDFELAELTTETAVVCAEVYNRGGVWKVRAVGQGYSSGLAGVATDFGISIDNEPEEIIENQPIVSPTNSFPNDGDQPMQSELFTPAHAEVAGSGIQKQGSKMCRVGLSGEVMARSGSMVAYQGDLRFAALGAGGIGNAIKQRLSGEGVPLMKVSGTGDLFLANAANDVHLIDLDGTDGLTINGANVLAFDSSLSYTIGRVQGAGAMSNAGLFNCVFTGQGRIAITSDGSPVVLNVDRPTFADPQAAIAWSSSLATSVKTNDSFNLGTLMGRSTGERMTLAFSGQGFVIVQPSELPPGGLIAGTGGGTQAGSGMFGGLLG